MDKKFRKVFVTPKFPSRKAFSMHSATYSNHSCSSLSFLLVFVRDILFGVFLGALGSSIVIVLFKVAGLCRKMAVFSISFVLFENLALPFHHLCVEKDAEKTIKLFREMNLLQC